MRQEEISDAAEFGTRRGIIDDLRLVGKIAAGHDDGPIDAAKDQMMQRRIGQHEAERHDAWRNTLRQGDIAPPIEQHDRRGRTRRAQQTSAALTSA